MPIITTRNKRKYSTKVAAHTTVCSSIMINCDIVMLHRNVACDSHVSKNFSKPKKLPGAYDAHDFDTTYKSIPTDHIEKAADDHSRVRYPSQQRALTLRTVLRLCKAELQTKKCSKDEAATYLPTFIFAKQ